MQSRPPIHDSAEKKEDKIMNCVSELWNTRLLVYCGLSKKTQEWREISWLLNLPVLLKVVG